MALGKWTNEKQKDLFIAATDSRARLSVRSTWR